MLMQETRIGKHLCILQQQIIMSAVQVRTFHGSDVGMIVLKTNIVAACMPMAQCNVWKAKTIMMNSQMDSNKWMEIVFHCSLSGSGRPNLFPISNPAKVTVCKCFLSSCITKWSVVQWLYRFTLLEQYNNKQYWSSSLSLCM